MESNKTYTLSELRAHERAAFVAGARYEESTFTTPSGWYDEAAKQYPAPTQPRVITTNGTEYRVIDGKLQWRPTGGIHWFNWSANTDSLRAVVDLLDNPTEPVTD